MSADVDFVAKALGRIPSGLFIVTVAAPEGRTGYLASLLQQVSLDPPLIAVAVAPDRAAHGLMASAKRFAVHLVEDGQSAMLKHFSKGFAPGEDAFKGLHLLATEPPLIEEMRVRMVVERRSLLKPGGDHDLFIGEIVDAQYPHETAESPKPWLHLRRNGRSY